MNLSLRAKLRLSEGCSEAELQDTCNRYYTIYKGVLDNSTDAAVRELAEKKLTDLVNCARAENITLESMAECSNVSSSANISATVEAELASLSGRLSPDKAVWLNNKINALPQSAKRNYLSALVKLNAKETTVKGFEEALSKLASAAKEDPDNAVYPALIDRVERELRDYRARLSAWRDEKKREEEIKRRREWWRAFFETLGAILSGIGSVLLWIGGAILTVAGGIISCICSGCDAC